MFRSVLGNRSFIAHENEKEKTNSSFENSESLFLGINPAYFDCQYFIANYELVESGCFSWNLLALGVDTPLCYWK